VPPLCAAPHQQRTAQEQEPDTQYDEWIQKVAEYLAGLDQETQEELRTLPQPAKALRQIANAFDNHWFRADKLRRLVEARGDVIDRVDDSVNTLSAHIAIVNQYADAVLQSVNRVRSPAAKQALEVILDLTHADEVTL
jgi:hypothetical protein